MTSRLMTLAALLLLTPPLAADQPAAQPAADQLRLQQLNREHQQQLEQLQRPPGPGYPPPLDDRTARDRLNYQQQTEQRRLQDAQQRQQSGLQHRSKVAPATPRNPVPGLIQQQQFRQQQQQQLQQFRLQQQLRPQPPPVRPLRMP